MNVNRFIFNNKTLLLNISVSDKGFNPEDQIDFLMVLHHPNCDNAIFFLFKLCW